MVMNRPLHPLNIQVDLLQKIFQKNQIKTSFLDSITMHKLLAKHILRLKHVSVETKTFHNKITTSIQQYQGTKNSFLKCRQEIWNIYKK